MKLSSLNVNSDVFQVLLVAAGVGFGYALYVLLSGVVNDMKYQTVFGIENTSSVAAPSPRTLALPVVEASSPPKLETAVSGVTDDARIEAAFKAPELEAPEEEKKVEEKRLTLSQQLFLAYRPTVQGLGAGGVFIKGQYWALGEAVVVFPLRDVDGKVIYPTIKSVGAKGVVLAVGMDQLTLSTAGVR